MIYAKLRLGTSFYT